MWDNREEIAWPLKNLNSIRGENLILNKALSFMVGKSRGLWEHGKQAPQDGLGDSEKASWGTLSKLRIKGQAVASQVKGAIFIQVIKEHRQRSR